MSATPREWRPLGVLGTLRFFLTGGRKVASWRHFGWELEVERDPFVATLFQRRQAS